LNASGRAIVLAGVPVIQLDGSALLGKAQSRAGLEDFGEDGFSEALRRLLHSLEREAGLSLIGRIAARQDLVRVLTNRLRLVDSVKRRPEIAAEEIRRPLFVTGLPRTGTTLLQGLLAQDPTNRVPLHWELVYPPATPESPDHQVEARIAAAERQLRWFHRLQPDIRRIHPLGARLPEECLVITSLSFLSFQFQTTHRVPAYQKWLEAGDLRNCYRWHRRMLQHLQYRCRGARWVLKAPAHLFGLPALFASYPDAGVIFTHREPLEVSPSLASLTTVLRRTFSDTVDPIAIGKEMTERWTDGIYRALRDRDAGCAPPARFFDVRYVDLTRDPIGTVRRIYTHYELPFMDVAEQRMRRFLADNPKDKHGKHRYSLADFGLERERESERYRVYRERFGLQAR
jgi:hypothetical protein